MHKQETSFHTHLYLPNSSPFFLSITCLNSPYLLYDSSSSVTFFQLIPTKTPLFSLGISYTSNSFKWKYTDNYILAQDEFWPPTPDLELRQQFSLFCTQSRPGIIIKEFVKIESYQLIYAFFFLL